MDPGPKCDKLNHVGLLTRDEVKQEAERRLGITGHNGYAAGSDQWLMWEAIYNLARTEPPAKVEAGMRTRQRITDIEDGISRIWHVLDKHARAITGEEKATLEEPPPLHIDKQIGEMLGVKTDEELRELYRKAENERRRMIATGALKRIITPYGELEVITHTLMSPDVRAVKPTAPATKPKVTATGDLDPSKLTEEEFRRLWRAVNDFFHLMETMRVKMIRR